MPNGVLQRVLCISMFPGEFTVILWYFARASRIQETALPVLCTHRFGPRLVLLGRCETFEGSAEIKGTRGGRRFKGARGRPKDPPKSAKGSLRAPQGPPKDARGAPKESQGLPKEPQGQPKGSQGMSTESPRTPKDRPRTPHPTHLPGLL